MSLPSQKGGWGAEEKRSDFHRFSLIESCCRSSSPVTILLACRILVGAFSYTCTTSLWMRGDAVETVDLVRLEWVVQLTKMSYPLGFLRRSSCSVSILDPHLSDLSWRDFKLQASSM